MQNLIDNPMGSIWHRWEPHIHTPETVLNDQFSEGQKGWDEFVDRVNASNPPINALGITDYFSIENYEKVVALKASGRFTIVDFVFPNVELRFDVATQRGNAINGHLLISPEDSNHVEMAKRFLNKLTFTANTQKFNCNRSDLILLGRRHKNDEKYPEQAALREGTNQFKVSFDEVISELQGDDWAKENIILAIAAGGDGTSGLSSDSSFTTIRKKMERHAQIIFSSSESQRKFWLGKGADSKQQIIETYLSCKPCIHGSDAHKAEDVGVAHENRFTWIKGDLKFESLRQICIEPENRVFIGEEPGSSGVSNTINEISVSNSEWLQPSIIPINSGLVAIIGARGSGKTALADLLATGGYGISQAMNDRSFIARARPYLDEVEVKLKWASGSQTTAKISAVDDAWEAPSVQYLSQQFVDKLCSAEGPTDELLTEVERVIFNAHPAVDRVGISDFQELLNYRASTARDLRRENENTLEEYSSLITIERNKKNSIDKLTKSVKEKEYTINQDVIVRKSLVLTGQEEREKFLISVNSVLATKTQELDKAKRKLLSLESLKTYVGSARTSTFPSIVSTLKQKHVDAAISERDWSTFQIDFVHEVDNFVENAIKIEKKAVDKIVGTDVINNSITVQTASFVTGYDNLNLFSFNTLKNESKRLELLIGVDSTNTKRYKALNVRIEKEERVLTKLKRELEEAQQASSKITNLVNEQRKVYKIIFDAILSEEEVLKALYEPLRVNLSTQSGTLGRLTFRVKRSADTIKWANDGEQLMDLRKQGDFRGRGVLLDAANAELKNIWEAGTAEQISQAVTDFRNKYELTIAAHSPVDKSDSQAFNDWGANIAKWLYGTDHISIEYGIQYDNLDLQQLSPGTRGIVLLLLYLAVDREDDRPLIIDQPEENLDPESIFTELAPLFMEVKNRRQLIIVTHNANLVVNTDADQVIVARCGDHRPGQLPIISYTSGGLEHPSIRLDVCKILEGGEDAFRERARRLRVSIANK